MVYTYGDVVEPPASQAFGLDFGSGGGPSKCASQNIVDGNIVCLGGFPKPAFQSKLPGKVRLVPDVSWLADPFTGVAIAITIPGQEPAQVWEGWAERASHARCSPRSGRSPTRPRACRWGRRPNTCIRCPQRR